MKKYFIPGLVVLLIFVFPAISYLYLRYGFEYRKEALEELKQQIDFDESQKIFLDAMDKEHRIKVNDGVHFFMNVTEDMDKKDLFFLAESFKARNDFKIHGLVNSELSPVKDTSFQNNLSWYHAMEASSFFNDTTKIILTSQGKIRKHYGESEQAFNKAYEHAVILLPMKKREKVKLIRSKEK